MKNGKVPENVLKRSVLRQIRTKREEVLNGAGVGVDCAVFFVLRPEYFSVLRADRGSAVGSSCGIGG